VVNTIADLFRGLKECCFGRQSLVNAKATGSLKTTSKPCQSFMKSHHIKHESTVPRKILFLG
jgi:hypothetical protein